MMGMKGWLYWAAWYFNFTTLLTISVFVVTLLFHVEIPGKMAIFSYGDPTVTFVFLLLYTISVMTFAFAISTFFSKGLKIVAYARDRCYNSLLLFAFTRTTSNGGYPVIAPKGVKGSGLARMAAQRAI